MEKCVIGGIMSVLIATLAVILFAPVRFLVTVICDVWIGTPFSPGSESHRILQEMQPKLVTTITLILLMSLLLVLGKWL